MAPCHTATCVCVCVCVCVCACNAGQCLVGLGRHEEGLALLYLVSAYMHTVTIYVCCVQL
jgi:hypothetical protein